MGALEVGAGVFGAPVGEMLGDAVGQTPQNPDDKDFWTNCTGRQLFRFPVGVFKKQKSTPGILPRAVHGMAGIQLSS